MKADITKVKDAVAIRASERRFVRGVLLTEMYIPEQQSWRQCERRVDLDSRDVRCWYIQ